MFDDKAFLWALGTMSGTSLDGVDAAMVLSNGEEIAEFGPCHYRPYSADEQRVLRRALGQWHDGPDVRAATEIMEKAHIEVLSRFEGAELIGFHGQTLAHDPAGRGTHQAGDGTRLARALNLPVVWDFRTADVAAGGQGAPLAPFFHHALARKIGADAPLAFLNLGGVGNITWVDPRLADPADPNALLAFDTGPANAPINDLMQARLGLPFDEGAKIAAKGQVDQKIIAAFEANPFFDQPPPKSLDRDDFKALLAMVEGLCTPDAAATLTQAAALSVLKSAAHFPAPVSRLLVTGGGRLNPVIMQTLAQGLGCQVEPVEAAGLNGDMLEAQAFAYLALRTKRGLPLSAPKTTAVPRPMTGGRLSLP